MKRLRSFMIGLLGLSIIILLTPNLGYTQCNLTCNPPGLQVSLDENCLALVTPDDILEGSNSCTGPLTVQVFDPSGIVITTNPIVDGTYLGQTLGVRVTDEASGNFCESSIFIVDNIRPIVTCSNLNLSCNASTHPDDIGYAMVSDNCDGNPLLSFSDVVSNPSCAPSSVLEITRTWIAEDASGNVSDPCVQTIILERANLAEVQFPADVNDIDAPSLDCLNPDISADNTGYPSLNNIDLINGTVCEIWITQSDAGPFFICEGSYRILRTWTITDECTGASISDVQEIKVLDKTGPVINCADDIFVSASANSCEAFFILPDAIATDDCSSSSNISIAIENENGENVNPGTVINLPIGVYTYTYIATDDCGNIAECSLEVTIDDGVNPVAICNSFTTVSLGSAGTTLVPANTFDDGSYDNCGPLTYLARRMDNPGCPGNDATVFDLDVPFYCCDVGDTIMVEMQIRDAINRLSNSCMIEVFVQEKLDPEISCPPDITLDCALYSVDPSVAGEPEASDNCGISDITFVDVEDLSICNTGTITRTWTVNDNHGQSAVCVQTITLIDTTDVVIIFPADVNNAECGESNDLSITGEPVIEDDCGLFAVNMDDTVIEFENGCTVKTIRVWSVYDWCNDTTYIDVQVIKAFDTQAPVFSGIPTDMTVECDAVPPMDMLTAIDACDNGDDVISSETINPGSCVDEYDIIRKWFTIDNCGNADSLMQIITVIDSTPPEIFGESPDTLINCDVSIPEAILTATDNCDPSVMLEMTENIIDGTCADEYMIVRTWTATDNCGNQAVRTQNISVQDTIAPVLLGVPMDMSVECDMVPGTGMVTTEDNCDTEVELVFNEEITPGACVDNYTITRTWTAIDNCGNQTFASQTILVEDTTNPILSGVPMDVTVECGAIPDVATVTATDNCDLEVLLEFNEETVSGICDENVTITRTWTATDNCGNSVNATQVITSMDTEAPILIGVPIDMTAECGAITDVPVVTVFDNCDENVMINFTETVTPGTCDENVTVVRTWTATDACGNTTSETQTITSEDILAPILIGIPDDISVECGEIPDAPEVTAMDNCLANVMVMFDEQEMAGACAEDVVITRTWTAVDNCGNITVAQQIISSSDITAPTLNGVPVDMTVECGMIPNAPIVTAMDNCDMDIVVVFEEDVENGICTENITVTRTWTATDNCGNTTSETRTITSSDTEAPILIGIPNDTLVHCESIPSAPILTATDNCDTDVMILFEEMITEQNCENEYVLTWKWTATDNCGNTTMDSTTLEVVDDTAPVLMGVPANITVECTMVPAPPMPTATDNCDNDPEILFDEFMTGPSCGGESYQIFRTWTAIDNCENQSIRTQIITLFDNSPPVFTNTPNDLTVECDSIPIPDLIEAMEECMNGEIFTVSETTSPGVCTNSYTLNRIYTVTDSCGNSDDFTQVITVEDNTAPTITCPNDITFDIISVGICSFIYSMSPDFMDNCDPTLDLDYTIDFGDDGIIDSVGTIPGFPFLLIEFPIGDNTITFNVSDDCGNVSSCSTSVQVNDLVPPAFFCNPQTVALNISDSTAFVVPSSFLLDPFLECCLDSLSIQDLDNPGQVTDTLFLDFDDFVLSQMIGGIPIQIFAVDCYGNTSSCSTKVFVQPPMSPPGFGFITGDIFTEEGDAMVDIEVNLDGGMSDEAMTTSVGAYEFMDIPENYNYHIEPFHNEDPMNGVTTWDLILLQRHILGIDLLDSPYKIIAGDINRSGSVSTFDIVELRKMILGINTLFQSNTSWRFVDANFVFPNEIAPFESPFPEFCSIANLENGMVDMSFVAVKTGDLNGSAETNFNGTIDDRNLSTISFKTADQDFKKEDLVIVPIRAKDFENVLGFQYSLVFDPDVLAFESMEAINLPDFNDQNLGFEFLERGLMTCSWFKLEEQSRDSGSTLFELRFKAKKNGKLSDILKINSDYTKAEFYRKNKEIAELDLQFENAKTVNTTFELFQNRPNPFQKETLISFSLKESSAATISIFNASGKLIWQAKGNYPQGYNELVIRKDELEGSGLYFYQLRTPDGLANKRMVLLE